MLPYLCLRDHTGPIFAVAGFEHPKIPMVVFSAGSEGIIKAWSVPPPEEPLQYGPTTE